MNELDYDWLFFIIYPGNMEVLDAAVEDIVKPTVETLSEKVDVQKWFFIRYLDETGPHIRLRFLLPIEEMELAMEFLESFMNERLNLLQQKPVQAPKRLLPMQPANNPFASGNARIELSLYEPEVDKYGGPEWIERAEDLFHQSSIMNIKLIEQIRNEQVNRFNLGLRLMYELLLHAEGATESQVAFLEEYLQYWSGDRFRKDGGANMSDSFKKSASSRIEITKAILKKSLDDYPEVESIQAYLDCSKKIFTNLKNSSKREKYGGQFCFNFIHMTNNRLGVWPIEESYLAALLLLYVQKEPFA